MGNLRIHHLHCCIQTLLQSYHLCLTHGSGVHYANADIVKFYGCELGAQTKYDKKDGTSIVNGAHDTGKLCELLEVSFHSMAVQHSAHNTCRNGVA